MKVIIGANISANGKVLLEEAPDHQVPQQEAIDFLNNRAVQLGNLVIGRKILETIEQMPGGVQQMFPGVEIVLLSSNDTTTTCIKVVSTPEEAINYLSGKGFNTVAVGGGTTTYNAFLDKDLVTDIYFNIVPIFAGGGGVLGTNSDLTTKFKLAGHTLLADDIVQLHLTKV